MVAVAQLARALTMHVRKYYDSGSGIGSGRIMGEEMQLECVFMDAGLFGSGRNFQHCCGVEARELKEKSCQLAQWEQRMFVRVEVRRLEEELDEYYRAASVSGGGSGDAGSDDARCSGVRSKPDVNTIKANCVLLRRECPRVRRSNSCLRDTS